MAYHVSWIVRHQVLYISLSDEITLADFRDSTKQIADYMDDAYSTGTTNLIIGIIDLTHAKLGFLMRSAISVAQDISDVIDPRHWNAKPGFVVLITVSEAAKLLTSVIIRISKQPMTTVASLNEALAVVCSMYPDLQTQIDTYQASEHSAGTAT
ncbi:MAG: hypothetical protein SF123_14340 [Chloroflexota bacterium]|nr:hypothetical protein [Chloroflexota bacterium]